LRELFHRDFSILASEEAADNAILAWCTLCALSGEAFVFIREESILPVVETEVD